MLRIVSHTVSRVGRSYEQSSNGFELHPLPSRRGTASLLISGQRSICVYVLRLPTWVLPGGDAPHHFSFRDNAESSVNMIHASDAQDMGGYGILGMKVMLERCINVCMTPRRARTKDHENASALCGRYPKKERPAGRVDKNRRFLT